MAKGGFVDEMEAGRGDTGNLLFTQVSPLWLTEAPWHAYTGHNCGPGLEEPSHLFDIFIVAHLFPFLKTWNFSKKAKLHCIGFLKSLMPFWYFGFSATYKV